MSLFSGALLAGNRANSAIFAIVVVIFSGDLLYTIELYRPGLLPLDLPKHEETEE